MAAWPIWPQKGIDWVCLRVANRDWELLDSNKRSSVTQSSPARRAGLKGQSSYANAFAVKLFPLNPIPFISSFNGGSEPAD
jgi:hypothetical protein